MYLPLSSALDLMFLAWLGLVLLTGIMWWRRAVGRKWLVTMSLLVLAIGFGSTSLCKHVAVGSLEWQFPPRTEPLPLHQVIVVLGGDILPPDQGRPEAELAESTLMRCLTAARLYRESGRTRSSSSDGAMHDTRGIQVADVMRDFMRTQQIDATDLIVETESRSTYENAVGVAPYLKENNPSRRVVLVTDAMHLWRARACFAAQDVDTIPVGARYRATRLEPTILRTIMTNSWSAAAVVETRSTNGSGCCGTGCRDGCDLGCSFVSREATAVGH
jgi:uncharacterized SAM-binding protein YcdF (DUF218 family)